MVALAMFFSALPPGVVLEDVVALVPLVVLVLKGVVPLLLLLLRLEICQMFYTTRFSGQKFYTVKTRILRLFLLTIKQRRCHYQLVLSFFLLKLK